MKADFIDFHAGCGFPSPAADFECERVTLDDIMIDHRHATVIVEATGDSMVDAGIYPGDRIIVDRALEARDGSIILANYDGNLLMKRLRICPDGSPELLSENAEMNYRPVRPAEGEVFTIIGVVTGLMRRL
ncbi:LexA family transcriptional regulator [Sutterella sp.]|uniref:LexA family protein n=1 Tax=Sutterella sp. TaxID=1981025 RepID=UPI0026E0556F|nr:S24 family peptidase [Sutterella sp.]MDO5532105.1 S24 family peptidase [Sutterella sp.]